MTAPSPEVPAPSQGESRRRPSPVALGLAVLALPVLVGLGVRAVHAPGFGRPGEGLELDHAAFAPLAFEAPRGVRSAAAEVALPDVWSDGHRDVVRGRYAFAFRPGEAGSRDLALYVPGLNARAAVRVNGHLLGSAADVPGLASRHWLVPLYRSIPHGLLEPGENRLEIELSADHPGTGVLDAPWLGEDAALRPAYELRRFLQVTGIQILVIALVSVGLFLALLSLLRRKDTTYAWFAGVLWIFAFGFWNLLAIESRIPKPPYRWVGAVTMAWLSAAILVFVHRFLGERRVRLEGAVFAAVAAGSVFFWVTQGTDLYAAALPFWGAAVLAVGVVPGARVARELARRRSGEMAAMVGCGLLLAGAGVHDVALVNGAFGVVHDFAIQYAAAVSAAVFSGLFVTRLIEALDTSEALSAELSRRVAEKAEEIAESHRRLRRLESDRAIAGERERILGEIHDGLGGQLVSALAMVRHGEGDAEAIAAALQAALDDMRLVIHSLDDVDGDLGVLLGSLRERLGSRLARSGLQLHWQIEDTPAPRDFGPEAALQVLRIAQEAITNVLKHAGARQLWIRTRCDGSGPARRVRLEVEDDGRGLDRAGAAGGRGLSQMERRAARIGADLKVGPGAVGTRVRLSLPAAADEGASSGTGGRAAETP